MQKILFYNWVQFDDDENRGGGVTLYQKNLISRLIETQEKEIYFISSGIAYAAIKKDVFVEKTKNIFGRKCHTFRIVNSPILSPGYFSFNDMNTYLTDESLHRIFKEFVLKHGPFDVIHFNNYEGLSLQVLKIKENFPDTKVIYSLHNYYAFCPQVNLWKSEKSNCVDYENGKDCLTCLKSSPEKAGVLFASSLAYELKKFGFKSQSIVFKASFKFAGKLRKLCYYFNKIFIRKRQNSFEVRICSGLYENYRQNNVSYINQYVDHVLCVSERVRKIAVDMGIEEKKASTNYIGTLLAEHELDHCNADINSPVFTIAFMGYMRKDKGFYFLMKALNKMDQEIAADIRVILAAKITDDKILGKVRFLGKKFHEIILKDGYTHQDFSSLLKSVNLGIIPVLWEDNLPQVAIEMLSNGIPLLSSDLGGASELYNKNPMFTFKSGDVDDFLEKIKYLTCHREALAAFWSDKPSLTTMEKHIVELEKYYFG